MSFPQVKVIKNASVTFTTWLLEAIIITVGYNLKLFGTHNDIFDVDMTP